MNNKPLNISFQPKDLDYLANLLARQPWGEVNHLIVDMQNQVAAQNAPPAAPTTPVVSTPLPEIPTAP
jgi:hypothetical protein